MPSAQCSQCGRLFAVFALPIPDLCASCREKRKRASWKKASQAYRDRKQVEKVRMTRRKEANRLYVRAHRIRRKHAQMPDMTQGPARYGVGGEAWAWLGRPLRQRKDVDVSALPPVPPGTFNDRVTARPGRKPKKSVRYCSREGCERPLNLGRHKTKGDVCRKCRDADTAAAKQAQQQAEEYGTAEEIRQQLEETMSAEELDRMLDEDDDGR